MKYTPKKEYEISRFSVLRDGKYPFTVLESEEVPSKSANNAGRIMAKLKLAVHRPDGGDQWVWDYFADWFSEWKLKHFLECVGMSEAYESGNSDFSRNAMKSRVGYVRIKTELTNNGQERNVVDDYVVREVEQPKSNPTAKANPAQATSPDNTDDVPF